MVDLIKTLFTWGIALTFLAALLALWIDEYRASASALGLGVIFTFMSGDAWVDGFIGALVLSPLLLVLVPLAKKLKQRYRRRNLEQQFVAEMKAKATHNQKQRRLHPKPTAQDRKAEQERKLQDDAAKMQARLRNDPISAVLCPQVPIRFAETPRSWLGGLPQMPDDIPWPRAGQTGTPLNFAAQICCADLPANLWQGQGPREGWLLLFIDGLRAGNDVEDEANAWSAVLHITDLGPERAAPDNLNPVQDIIMSGAHYDDAFDQRDVPTVWRKWPIDIIPQKIVLEKGKVVSFQTRQFALQSTTTKDLYGIESQADAHPRLDPDLCPPLTWGGAHRFVKMAIKHQRECASRSATDYSAKSRSKPGWVAAMIREIEIDLEKPQKALDIKAPRLRAYENAMQANDSVALAALDASDQLKYPSLRTDVPALEKRINAMNSTKDRLQRHIDPAAEQALCDAIKANAAGTPDWWADQGPILSDILQMTATHNPDTPMPAEEWATLYAQITGIQREIIRPERRYDDDRADGLSWANISAVDRAWTHNVAREHYLHLYAHSPALRDLIPAKAQDKVAEIARAINWGRPHRMGGLADPLQRDIAADDPPLLFQIASDDALNWMWGDAGAIYVRTSDAELRTHHFKGIGYLECH